MQEPRPIIALDFEDKQQVATFLQRFPQNEALYLKVGMELYYREGAAIVQWLKEQGHAVFLDLKLHDIPNTVEKSMRQLARLGVDLTNVHAAGGLEMMEAARRGLLAGCAREQKVPDLIAVTQLTSTTEAAMQRDQLIERTLAESVAHYAQTAAQAGLQGVVCSALEVPQIHVATTTNFGCLTPGIRPKGAEVQDQARVVTPAQAKKLGSRWIVVGRPITQAENPYATYCAIKNEWNGVD